MCLGRYNSQGILMKYLYLALLLLAFAANLAASNVVVSLSKSNITISVGERFYLNSIYNTKPLKQNWDVSGRIVNPNRDSIYSSFAQIGNFKVNYTAEFSDTIVKLICYVNVIDTYKLDIDYSIDRKNGYTDLTITSKIIGDSPTMYYELNPSNNQNYSVIDSSLNKIVYRINKSGQYSSIASLKFPNNFFNRNKILNIVVPVDNLPNTEFNLSNLKRVSNFSIDNDNLFFQEHEYFSITSYNPRNPKEYNIQYYIRHLLNKIKNDYTIDTLTNNSFGNSSQHNINLPHVNGLYSLHSDPFSNLKFLYTCRWYSSDYNDFFIYKDSLPGPVDTLKGMPILGFKEFNINKINNGYFVKCISKNDLQATTSKLDMYYLDNTSKSYTVANGFDSTLYFNSLISSNNNSGKMLSINSKINLFGLDSLMKINATLVSLSYSKYFAKSINKNFAYSIIEPIENSKSKQLVSINLEANTFSTYNLDSTIQYHQIYQTIDSVNFLVGIKNNQLVISSFKDNCPNFVDFVISVDKPYKIIGISEKKELHLSYIENDTIGSYFRTKGIDTLFKYVSSFIDSTKYRATQNNNSNATIYQDADYKTAKVHFVDSLDLSDAILKIYTITGDEILTYSLSKDQKELPIETDKLYIGTYYARLLKNNEEHNIGKFVIMR